MNRSDLSPIEHRVSDALRHNFPVDQNPTFIVGVSGGVDSMCLLYVLKKLNVDGVVVHVNYGKRGTESDKDAELVEQMAFQWGFDCQTLCVDSQEAGEGNFQQWARSVRYDIFRSLAGEYDTDGIAVAHHQDDQVETILQKQFRGAGLASWSAMNIWDGQIFRPLLNTSRKEVEDYAERESIPYRTDRSNLETDFARNFLRNEWLAELENHFPGWKQNVLRMAEEAELFGTALEWISERLAGPQGGISRNGLLAMDSRLRKALVLHEIKKVEPEIQIGRRALDELDGLYQLQTGKALQLTEGLSLMRDREHFSLINHDVEVQQATQIDRSRLEAEPFITDDMIFEIVGYDRPDFSHHLYLDADKISWPVKLRRWKEGDRFQPFGMEGHQKVSDHLTNRKVSAAQKNQALVVESFEDTIYAVIFPPVEQRVPPGTISGHVRCDETTRRCLTIKRRT